MPLQTPEDHNLEKCFRLIFITLLLYRRCFFLIVLSWRCTSKFNVLCAFDFLIKKLKKESSASKTRLISKLLLSKTSGAIQACPTSLPDNNFKHVPYSTVSKAFNCIANKIILILVSKNTLKAIETVRRFSYTFYHGPRFTVTSLVQRNYF